jgi:SAM-dependent methyltransferase
MKAIRFDPGSFKDPEGRVFYHEDKLFRALKPSATLLLADPNFSHLTEELTREGLIPRSETVEIKTFGDQLEVNAFKGALQVERISPVTYPYEWSFEMLKDAALLTLELIERSLLRNFILKDATSFNILFHRNRPSFIDIFSFVPYQDGMPWMGYQQFCRSFLYPLLIKTYRGIEFQSLLAGSLGEIPTPIARAFFRWSDAFKPGVLKDILLHSLFDQKLKATSAQARTELFKAHFSKEMILGNIRRLRKILENLSSPAESHWADYANSHSYSEIDFEQKTRIVAKWLNEMKPKHLVDLGSNTGTFSNLAQKTSEFVTSVDADADAIDLLYKNTRGLSSRALIVNNLAQPSPSQGWDLKERRALPERLEADTFLGLALIHHLRITAGIPFSMIIPHFAQWGSQGVLEWIEKDDEMVRSMLAAREDVFEDYSWDAFEAIVSKHFRILEVVNLKKGQRKLCKLSPL